MRYCSLNGRWLQIVTAVTTAGISVIPQTAMMRKVHRNPSQFLVTVAAVAILATGLISCSQTSEEEVYIEESRVLDDATNALTEWTSLMDEYALLEITDLTATELITLIEDQLAVTKGALSATTRSITSFRLITPPEQCRELHLRMSRALTLQEQAFVEHKVYLEQILTTGAANEEQRRAANTLMGEADLEKQRVSFEFENCWGN